MEFPPKYEIKKPYWVFGTEAPCDCCWEARAVHEGFWECWTTGAKYPMLDEEPDFSKPHPVSLCTGCPQHPFVNNIFVLEHADMYNTTWGDFVLDMEDYSLANETEDQREARLQKERELEEARKLQGEANDRDSYMRKMAFSARRGMKKNEDSRKLARPCKNLYYDDKAPQEEWIGGKPPLRNFFTGSECWAWDYIHPKTKERITPHICMYQHPEEPGWRDEWYRDSSWKDNRFANLIPSKKLNRYSKK